MNCQCKSMPAIRVSFLTLLAFDLNRAATVKERLPAVPSGLRYNHSLTVAAQKDSGVMRNYTA